MFLPMAKLPIGSGHAYVSCKLVPDGRAYIAKLPNDSQAILFDTVRKVECVIGREDFYAYCMDTPIPNARGWRVE